jgi:protein-disulfide isomerase
MASRKEQKEQARAARLQQEQEHAAKTARTRRIATLGGVIAIAIIVIVVAIAISSGGAGKDNSHVNSAQAKATYATVNSLLSGIPQHGTVLGQPKAKVTMTYYGDLECPICRDFTLDYFPQFVQDQVRTGKVKVDYRSFCTASCNNTTVSDPQAVFNTQQVAAYAAGKQNLFWYYAELFYHEQGTEDTPYVTSSYLEGLAKQIPRLNLKTWQTDRTDPALADQVSSDLSEASKLGLQGTPTLIMSGSKGSEQVTGPDGDIPTYSDLAAAVQSVS